MSELFSDMVKNSTPYVRPEKMLVLKHKGWNYPSYYNAHKNTWGGLLEATVYTGNEIPNIPEAEAVDYREITGIK